MSLKTSKVRVFICFFVSTLCRYLVSPPEGAAVYFHSTQERNTTWQGDSSLPAYLTVLTSVSHSHILRLSNRTSSDFVVSSNAPLGPVLVRGERAVILHEERAVGARQPDWRDGGWAADGVPRWAAGGLQRRLGKQRRVSLLHRRSTF